jgi:hypothetical protein
MNWSEHFHGTNARDSQALRTIQDGTNCCHGPRHLYSGRYGWSYRTSNSYVKQRVMT